MTDQPKPDRHDGDGLLPCPFCGSMAIASMYSPDMLFKVECEGCTAKVSGFDQCQQDAIDAWNARPTRDAAEGAGPNVRLMPLLDLPPAEQFDIAFKLAENVGYVLSPDAYAATPQPAPDAMREALEPFLKYLKEVRERFPESTSDTIIVGGPYNLTYAHFEKLKAAVPAPVPPTDEAMAAMNEALASQYGIPDELWKGATKENPKVPSATGAAEPVAWDCELASNIDNNKNYGGWRYHLSRSKPCVPEGSIRNLRPLYASPPVRGDREAIARDIVTDWLGMFDPPPQIDFQQSEFLQGAIASALAIPRTALPVQPGAGEREKAIEECAKIAEETLIGHTLTPGGLARQDEAEAIAERIRTLSRQPQQSSREG